MIEIIIPAYNCQNTLDRALSSLETQTCQDFSVHVIDDCSKEDLTPIIERHSNLNIRVTRNKENKKQGPTRQVGIDATNADYIAFMDSDDVLMPFAVEIWKLMSESSPEVDIFHSWFYAHTYNDGVPAIVTVRDGYPWLHGKLYKVEFLKKFDIRFIPEVVWAEDSYFNSLCTELGISAFIEFPIYGWLYNANSVTRDPSSEYQNAVRRTDDFVHAVRLSVDKVLMHKDHIDSLANTMKNVERDKEYITESKADYEYLLGLLHSQNEKEGD